jgi:hypothetical protein
MRMPGDTEFIKQHPNPSDIEDNIDDHDLIGGLGITDKKVDPNITVMEGSHNQ